jgi:hypothetical protein
MPPVPVRRHRSDPRLPSQATSPKPVWSTGRVLPSKYHTGILEGMDAAALKFGLVIHPQDKDWFTLHHGHFQKYFHPQSKEGRQLFQSKICNRDENKAIQYCTDHNMVWGASPRYGSTQNSPNYCNNLENFLNQLWRWLLWRRKYESMLILLPNPPRRCPALDQEELLLFAMFKFLPTNSKISLSAYHPISGEPVCTNFEGLEIKCEGTIRNIKYFDTLFAAIRQVHIQNTHMADYRKPCPECVTSFISSAGTSRMCADCSMPGYCPHGNPTCDKEVKNYRKWLISESERRKYREKPRSPLFPSDLVDIQKFVEGSGFHHLKHFEFYTMVLCGIYLFGRFDEYHDLEISDFDDPKCQVLYNISNSVIECIALSIDGSKNHGQDAYYQIFFNDDMPRQCFLRHLLVWLHITGIESGSIFPNPTDLYHNTLLVNGFHSKVSDQLFNSWLQAMLSKHCRHSAQVRAGTHTLKVTAFLLAIMGGGEFQSIKRNARHKDDKSAIRYYTDGVQTMERIQKNPLLARQQSTWKFRETLVHQVGDNQERLNRFVSDRQDVSLKEAVNFFVVKMMGVPADSPHYKDPNYLLLRSYSMNFARDAPISDPYSECMFYVEPLPPAIRNPIARCLQKMMAARICDCGTNPLTPVVPRLDGAILVPSFVHLKPPSIPGGKYDIDKLLLESLRRLSSTKRVQSLYQLILEIELVVQSDDPSSGVNGAVTCAYLNGKTSISKNRGYVFTRFLDKFQACLSLHFSNDLVIFLQVYPDYNHTKFRCTCGSNVGTPDK